MRLILMRHGYCKGLAEGIINGWNDYPLVAKGKKETVVATNATKKLLGDIKIDKVYTSYLSRTYETADIFAKEFQFKGSIKQDIRLNERHYGMFQGMKRIDAESFKEFNSLSTGDKRLDNKLIPENDVRHNAFLNEYSMKLKKPIKKIEDIIPRSESVLDVEKRLEDFVSEIMTKSNQNSTILIVSHANPLKLIVKILNDLSYKQTSKLRFATCGMKIYDMRYKDGAYEIITEYNINKEWES